MGAHVCWQSLDGKADFTTIDRPQDVTPRIYSDRGPVCDCGLTVMTGARGITAQI